MKNPKHEALLKQVAEILYPAEDPDKEWDADTIDDIGTLMTNAGYHPRDKPAVATPDEQKLGGAYAIEDPELRHEMAKLNTDGMPCDVLEYFTRHVFRQEKDADESMDDRYLACFMPASYSHDLSNTYGCASPMDAAKAYVDIILDGYSVFVWDRLTRMIHYTEQNKYIYGGLEDLTDSKRVLDAMTDEGRLNLFSRYCRGCGCIQPDTGFCQCQNDE